MARLPRLALAGHVHHVIQRGTGAQLIARDDADRQRWLDTLADCVQALEVAVHAYVLLPDELQLLVTPAQAGALPALMQALGRRYVRYFNDRHQRRGTLWEGRYRATVIEAGRYLLPAMAHLDLSPVRAGLAARPAQYAWSSHGHYAGLLSSRIIKPHALWWSLGNTPFAREAAYVAHVEQGVSEADRLALVRAARQGWALGGEAFVALLQKESPRRVVQARAGRPPRARPASV
ncbi:MAG: transposase [Comamonas sp.]